MATDIPFQIAENGVLFDPSHRACRTAALYRLGARDKLHTVTPETLQPIYDKVLQRWRLRVVKLRDAGWNYMTQAPNPDKRFVFTRNCPPHGAVFNREKRLYRCRRAKVCPHCYSRDVVMQACVAFEVGLKSLPDADNLHLVGFQRLLKRSVEKWPIDKFLPALSAPGVHTAELQPLRNVVVGSVMFVNVALDSTGSNWLVRRSGVFITERDNVDVPFPGVDNGHSVRTLDKCNMQNAGRLIGWAGRYPASMLTSPPEQTAELLNHLEASQFKQIRFGGMLRNSYARKRRMQQIVDSQKPEKV